MGLSSTRYYKTLYSVITQYPNLQGDVDSLPLSNMGNISRPGQALLLSPIVPLKSKSKSKTKAPQICGMNYCETDKLGWGESLHEFNSTLACLKGCFKLTYSLLADWRPLICNRTNFHSLRFVDHWPWSMMDQNFPRPQRPASLLGATLAFWWAH